MNFFGIGPMELILILVIALIVFGPGRMPEIGKSMGAAIREFRRASQELTNELTRDVELSEIKEEVKAVQAEITQPVQYGAAGGVSVELEEAAQESEPPVEAAQEPNPPVEVAQEPRPPVELLSVTGTPSPDTMSTRKRIARRAAANRRDRRSLDG